MCWLAAKFEICSVEFTLVIQFQIHNRRRSVSRTRHLGGFPLANLFGRIDVFFSSNKKM